MQISQNLKLKQSQSLVMTPQLQQAIKLHQLNNLELTNLVNKELEENPFLENESVELDNQNDQDTEKTDELDESFENGESIADEPCNDDFENRWDNDATFEFNTTNNNITVSYPKYAADRTFRVWTSTGGTDDISVGTDPSVVDVVNFINNRIMSIRNLS